MRPCRPLLLGCACLLAGCGATTIRVEVAPTIDGGGRAGVESALSLGIGMPLDYHGRSHHYLQGLASLGGGLDGPSRSGEFLAAVGADYIYWAEPTLDVRAGGRYSFRKLGEAAGGTNLHGFGGHLGILPMVTQSDGNWMVMHLCLGPEARVEALWSSPPAAVRSLFSLPLVLELNLLAAGD